MSSTEIIVLLAILVLLFGSSKLPKLGNGLGEGIRNFKKSLKGEDADEDKKSSVKSPDEISSKDSRKS